MKNFLKQYPFFRKYGFILLGILIMAVLFFSSAQTYEQQSQVSLIGKILHNEPFKEQLSTISFEYAGGEVSIEKKGYTRFVEFFIRKGAHFGSYFLMGFFLCMGLYSLLKNIGLASFFAWLSSTGYAGLDEFHQSLTGGRTPLIQDVILDSAGACTAVLLCLIWYFWQRIRKRR